MKNHKKGLKFKVIFLNHIPEIKLKKILMMAGMSKSGKLVKREKPMRMKKGSKNFALKQLKIEVNEFEAGDLNPTSSTTSLL